jgi:hypothetical protein
VPHPAFALDEYVPPEVDLQAAGADAFDKLLRPPAMWTAMPMGHIKLTGQQAARLHRIGAKRNWPDHLILHGGRLIGIEWKKPGTGKLSITRIEHTKRGRPRLVEGQREVFPRLKAAGMIGPFECSSVDHALRILRALEVPMLAWEVMA